MTLLVNFTMVPLCVDFDSPEDFLIFIFHLLWGIGTVLVAGSVVCGILNTRALLAQHRFLFMLNTSVSDTLTGCAIFYQFLFDVKTGFPSRNGTYYIVPSLLGVNMMTFLFAQIDRYFAVCHPFFYGRFISAWFIVCLNLYSWVHVYAQLLIQNMVPLSLAIEIGVFSRVSLMGIVATKISMTIKLLFVARFQLLREPPSPERDSKKESLFIIIIVVLFFLILFFPAVLYTILSWVTGKYISFRNDAVNPLRILSRSNALCTPSLYLWGSPALRAAVWRTVWGKICCSRGHKRLVTVQLKRRSDCV
ncbi:G-protein coupled receptor 183-like [Salarias fasciatus]|uniref:G-protein coupled receptor 183-like n=1 Tax=Salarias fasciatus TaxID=181472 RepID=UPI001176A36A|nr:G-protein coupled receptor 183-like [Salarias fasciatus]